MIGMAMVSLMILQATAAPTLMMLMEIFLQNLMMIMVMAPLIAVQYTPMMQMVC